MSETIENLILDLLEWLQARERTYQETMDAWRTSCPRLPVWEEASERGLLTIERRSGRSVVCVASAGRDLLEKARRSVNSPGASR